MNDYLNMLTDLDFDFDNDPTELTVDEMLEVLGESTEPHNNIVDFKRQ